MELVIDNTAKKPNAKTWAVWRREVARGPAVWEATDVTGVALCKEAISSPPGEGWELMLVSQEGTFAGQAIETAKQMDSAGILDRPEYWGDRATGTE